MASPITPSLNCPLVIRTYAEFPKDMICLHCDILIESFESIGRPKLKHCWVMLNT